MTFWPPASHAMTGKVGFSSRRLNHNETYTHNPQRITAVIYNKAHHNTEEEFTIIGRVPGNEMALKTNCSGLL